MDTQNKKKRVVIIRQYTLRELALAVYCMSKYHLRKLLKQHNKQIGKRKGYYYETQQVELIFKLIPLPSDVELF